MRRSDLKRKEELKGSDWKEYDLRTNELKGSDWKENVLRRSVLKWSGFEERRKSEREVKER